MKKYLILLGLTLAVGLATAVPARAGITIEFGNGGIHFAKPYYGKQYYRPNYRRDSYRRYYGHHRNRGNVYYRSRNGYSSHRSYRRHNRPNYGFGGDRHRGRFDRRDNRRGHDFERGRDRDRRHDGERRRDRRRD